MEGLIKDMYKNKDQSGNMLYNIIITAQQWQSKNQDSENKIVK